MTPTAQAALLAACKAALDYMDADGEAQGRNTRRILEAALALAEPKPRRPGRARRSLRADTAIGESMAYGDPFTC